MDSSARAHGFEEPDDRPDLSSPIGEVPIASPGFRHSMTLLVLLSVPLWALIIGGAVLAVRWLG